MIRIRIIDYYYYDYYYISLSLSLSHTQTHALMTRRDIFEGIVLTSCIRSRRDEPERYFIKDDLYLKHAC